METNLSYCTRTGRTIFEKTMEDGNVGNTKDDKINSSALVNIYSERPTKLTTNGHEYTGEASGPLNETYEARRPSYDSNNDDKFRKRINPLRIHLGKRPFVDNSLQYYSGNKKKKPIVKSGITGTPTSTPRIPKLIPKRVDKFYNAPSQDNINTNEHDKPTPRLVPKSQLLQYKKKRVEKEPQLKEYAQSLGLQPMVKFKCRKCCSMSFKTLAMLKEHQLICRAQAKEPALSPEAAPSVETNSGGPSRVTRKVYLCSACGTYYENWNLFLHMREVHNRHICLFCLGMFSKAEKLASHLSNKHNVKEFTFDSKEEFMNVYNGTLYLMCCVCDEICSEQDDFFNHDCNNVKPKPVPILVSKNAAKPAIKTKIPEVPNGPVVAKELPKLSSERKNIERHEIIAQSQKLEINESETKISDSSISSDNSATVSKDTVDSGMEMESSDNKPPSSPVQSNSPEESKMTNGDDNDHSDDSDSPVPDEVHPFSEPPQTKEQYAPAPIEKEKEGGIKLKLSLNNANSPVIINSTVDPTIGQQKVNKPPTRVRRPPKRYEKEASAELPTPVTPKPPSIKMTICDRADSPFVKTTIYENNKELTVKTLLNNNLDSTTNTVESKPENSIKTTIYDNKLEDINTLNRVPKLTVRVPKELLDKDSSSDYSSDSDLSDKLTVDENNVTIDEQEKLNQVFKPEEPIERELEPSNVIKEEGTVRSREPSVEKSQIPEEPVEATTPNTEPVAEATSVVPPAVEEPTIPVTELSLDRPLDKYPLKDLLKVFLASTVYSCIYCNHVRRIVVNCEQLALHMTAQHRFKATVDSITAEELMPETITAKLGSGAKELASVYINLDSYDSVEKCETFQYDHMFECFQCYFKTTIHKDLYLHNRKMHQKTILLCVMCKSNFYSYSELICHICPGTYDSEYVVRFRCCLCNVDSIPSSFRLMVHLRKIHNTCDVCLEFCQSQARLSNHVWKHKLHHLCYRCGIAYRNKLDINNHLFWKHGTESVLCKRCLQKKWPHVYHFCVPPALFVCEECNLQFTKAVCLKVHKRFHSGEFPHTCTEENCNEKFVSKKLLLKHLDGHRKKLLTEDLNVEKIDLTNSIVSDAPKEPIIPVIDLADDKTKEEAGTSEIKTEIGPEQLSKKSKKKKLKDKDALLIDVNLPALNLSESDSSDESDSGIPPSVKEEVKPEIESKNLEEVKNDATVNEETSPTSEDSLVKNEQKTEIKEEEKPSEQQILDIWDNFKKYQAKVEKQKEKTPPLVPIKKHVCESDHDYCLIPMDMNGDDDVFKSDKKKNKKSPRKQKGELSSSSSCSSDSDSSCSCGSNCSCSSSSGSSSSSSSDSDSSESGNEKKKAKRIKKSLPNRRLSNGSNVDVMGNVETPILIPEKVDPPIAETDLETEESETDEEFYDEHPQRIANKVHEEKRNQLMLLASVAPSDGGSISASEVSRPSTPVKEEKEPVKQEAEIKIKPSSSKKKSKKKKKSKSTRKHGPIKINIPKDIIAKTEVEAPPPQPVIPNKITISLQSNTIQIPEAPKPVTVPATNTTSPATSAENKRASKRRRVPNKFYGYSSDEESTPQTPLTALKPQQPPKLEWRKEDLPSPVTHKTKKEVPSTILTNRLYNYSDSIRLTAPIPDPEPPRILMNSESMESSDSDSSEEGNLEIYQPNSQVNVPIPPPTYLNSGTSSLPYAFERPAVRQAREGESVYCYCRCPYDEVSEMIACDAEGCPIEWFHFECVGIMVPPKGKWYCPECRKNQSFSGYR